MLSKLLDHWDGWGSMEGRHLVFAYLLVALVQGGYFLWILLTWKKLNVIPRTRSTSAGEKAARPI